MGLSYFYYANFYYPQHFFSVIFIMALNISHR